MKRTHTLLAALLLGLTLILAGCGSGSGSDDDGVASATGKDSSDSKDSKDTSKEDRDAQGLKFAKCMREHGVKMEDPKGGRITIKGGPGQESTMKKAQEACQKFLPQISESDRKKMTEHALKFSQCMREHGVEKFPDPKGGAMRMDEGIAEDPDFEKAQEACQKYMGGPSMKDEKK
ncbi:hypothetical protein ASE12_02870 [Aeromicrobium sp. Root236]|uniref:hypothetical protein n=1 Tax=Aeromicrobium sp. Root236 TaxID=1736498 RepID=UPI0006F37ABF|nr:hypothetical protein [Aeromicrobium sp. Root236]KRC63800.1 hypothetical protein ASE12_02870 [Aeromicrobium sp. Root236]